jgi:hypothetical protein
MVTERAREMAKLIGCFQPAEPGKHPKNRGNFLKSNPIKRNIWRFISLKKRFINS